MISIVNGDILECKEDIICHQVNVFGNMGGGLARQIAQKFPETEKDYIKYCEMFGCNYINLSGRALITAESEKYIANMFSQELNFNTNYSDIEQCFKTIKEFAIKGNLSIAIPYKIGCGIANGNWEEVYKIIQRVFCDYNATIYKL